MENNGALFGLISQNKQTLDNVGSECQIKLFCKCYHVSLPDIHKTCMS